MTSYNCSIIVCCYNSATRLPETLKFLALQELKGIQCELIIVDNNSSDNTSKVASECWKEFGAPFLLNIVEEKNPGLSNARKKGIETALGDIIIFCDDDNHLSSNYVETSHQKLSTNTDIGIMCGASIAKSEVDLPIWFHSYQKWYAVGVFALESEDVTHHGWIWGAGMAFRKSLYMDLINSGFEHLLTDRKGKELSSGGDIEICKWFILGGYKLWYEDSIFLYHEIPKERLSIEYIKRLQKESSTDSRFTFMLYNFIIQQISFKKSLSYSIFITLQLIYHLLFNKLTYTDRLLTSSILWSFGIKDRDSVYVKVRSAAEKYRAKNKS